MQLVERSRGFWIWVFGSYLGLNPFSGSYASAMAGAAAGGEQNKAQPSNSSQRNRNSKCNIFYLNAEICSYLLKFVLKLLGLVFTMTESPLVLGREKMSLVRLSTRLTQLSTSRILTSLELAASGASLLLRYSRAELINTNFVSGRWISGELTAEIPVKETHYVIQESSLSHASVVF